MCTYVVPLSFLWTTILHLNFDLSETSLRPGYKWSNTITHNEFKHFGVGEMDTLSIEMSGLSRRYS